MKFAYSTNAYTRHRLDDAIRAIAELGFTGVELLCDRPHWFPGEVSEAEQDRIARLVAACGLGISNLNVNTASGYYSPCPAEHLFGPSLSHPDPAQRQWRQAYSIEAIRIAARIGAPQTGDDVTREMRPINKQVNAARLNLCKVAIPKCFWYRDIGYGFGNPRVILRRRSTDLRKAMLQTHGKAVDAMGHQNGPRTGVLRVRRPRIRPKIDATRR